MPFAFETTLAERIAQLSPVAYYKLNETSGTTAADSSGNGNDGVYTGGVTLDQAPLAWSGTDSRSALFDGSDDYVDLPATFDDQLSGKSAVSVHFLLNPDSLPSGSNEHAVMFVPINGTNAGIFIAYGSAGEVRYGARSSSSDSFQSQTTGAGVVVGGQTHACIAVFDFANDAIALHVNGVEVDASSVSFSASVYTRGTPTGTATLGAHVPASRFVAGSIDEIAVFDAALTAADAAALAARVVQETYADTGLGLKPAAYFPLSEVSGSTTFADTSGNNMDGDYSDTGSVQSADLAEIGGNAVELNGTYGTVPSAAVAPDSGGIGMWIKPDWSSDDGQDHKLFDASDPGGDYLRAQKFTDNNWYIGWRTGGTVYRLVITEANMPIVAGNTYWIAVTWDSSTISVYQDGALVATGSTTNHALTVDMVVFAEPGGADNFTGVADELMFFGPTPTAAQIEALYYRGTIAATVPVTYRIAGTVKEGNVAVARTVRLYDSATGALVAEAASDPGDGSYEFVGLETNDPVFVFGVPQNGYVPIARGPLVPVEAET